MLTKILKKDFQRKKKITIALFIFVMLSALLVASGSSMIMDLTASMNYLFEKSDVPDFVQMHSGDIDQAAIDRWVTGNSLVEKQQTVEMINIDGSNIYLGGRSNPEANSVMDAGFIRQNRSFDYLLDLDNQIIQVNTGEIAVPIYYMQLADLKLGDKIRLANQSIDKEFTITAFVRDAQMNPSIINSKRFVINEADFSTLKGTIGETEYLIEFQLTDPEKISLFSNAYASSNLPKTGVAVDYQLFKKLNMLTDGIVAAVIILVSILITVIALLCLGFTILATIEEDYREIGVMKAIGIHQREIKKVYLAKYVVMAALAAVLGFAASLFLNQLFSANIMLYFGRAPKSILQHFIPAAAAGLIFIIVIAFCILVLRRFSRITAVDALRSGNMGEAKVRKGLLSLRKSKFFDVNIFMGMLDVSQRFKMFQLLLLVFFICTFIIIIPLNLLNTLESPAFITYMGLGHSDIRIDLRQSDDIVERFNTLIETIENDPDVVKFSPLVTSKYKVINPEGVQENISIETGDFSIFPLAYLEGSAPKADNEIALSFLNSDQLQKGVGDTLRLVIEGQEREMLVTGIYQDVTNGGRTAKAASLPFDPQNVLWYVVSVDVRTNVDAKLAVYSEAFSPARVTRLEGYLDQTFGNTIDQLKMVSAAALVIAVFVSILITSLFMRMLIAKDTGQIAIMKSLGASIQDVRAQYITRALLTLNIGIILGTIASNTLGQSLVSAIWSQMGASNIQFVVDPLQAYILSPLALMAVVSVTTLTSISSIRETSITAMIAE